jgi:hypothetical protein
MNTLQHCSAPSAGELSLSLCGFGTARADLAAIASMRKSLPAWAPPDTPGHFLKHADEQTVLAVAAVDQAIQSSGLSADRYRDWAIVAAPRFIGRIAGVATLDRFGRGGGPAISPHLIPQHSLHSVSGALSILLASRQPNVGVGGAGNSLVESLLAALTFPVAPGSGTWVVCTSWDPEPQFDEQGQCLNAPIVYAVALAIEAAASGQTCGNLRLLAGNDAAQSAGDPPASTAELCRALAALTPGGAADCFKWQLPWGGRLVLEVRELIDELAAAA